MIQTKLIVGMMPSSSIPGLILHIFICAFQLAINEWERWNVVVVNDRFRCVAVARSRRAKGNNESRVRTPQSSKQSIGKSKFSLPCCAPTGFCAKRHGASCQPVLAARNRYFSHCRLMSLGQPLFAYSPRTRGGHLIGAMRSQKRTAWPGSVRLTRFSF